MDYRKTIRLYYDYVMPTYFKTPLVLERGNEKIGTLGHLEA